MWPKFSGCAFYPITTGSGTPEFEFHSTVDKWDDDEYGKLRRELCAWIAKELRKPCGLKRVIMRIFLNIYLFYKEAKK